MIAIDDHLNIYSRLKISSIRPHIFFLLALFVFLLLIYNNSFFCSWHFDDTENIVKNRAIHVQSLSWKELYQSFYGIINSGRWSRPFSYLSFALNYYVGGLDVYSYHVVNFLIHYATAIFLFLFVFNTLKLPLIKQKYEKYAYSIAILSTFLWASSPLQVTAVTYIVQRMASMAGLFYIMAMYFFLKGRTADGKSRKIFHYSLFVLSALFAFGTKENAAMLPITVFFYDLILIQGVARQHIKKNLQWAIFSVLIVILMALIYVDFSSLVGGYEHRSYSMWERLLTQPRVLLYYVSLLLYPVSSRLALLHDFIISSSLFNPWSTFAAIALIIIILVIALIKIKKNPLIAYCIIFFFLNHLIEGSFLSLELVYEHRNYIPSMLFFLPLSVLIMYAMDYYSLKRILFYTIVIAVTSMLAIQGITVYLQNIVFRDEISLWSDHVLKMPSSRRAHHNLGVAFLEKGSLPEAYRELTKSMDFELIENIKNGFRIYIALAQYHFYKAEYEEALSYVDKALEYDPYSAALYNLKGQILVWQNKDIAKALAMVKKAIMIQPRPEFAITYGKIELIMQNPDSAMSAARMALIMRHNLPQAYRILSDSFKLKGNENMSDHFNRLAIRELNLMNISKIPDQFVQ